MAGACYFTSEDGGRIAFPDNGESAVIWQLPDGSEDDCTWGRSDQGTGMRIVCTSGADGFFSFAAIVPGSGERDLLSFRDLIWRRVCE